MRESKEENRRKRGHNKSGEAMGRENNGRD